MSTASQDTTNEHKHKDMDPEDLKSACAPRALGELLVNPDEFDSMAFEEVMKNAGADQRCTQMSAEMDGKLGPAGIFGKARMAGGASTGCTPLALAASALTNISQALNCVSAHSKQTSQTLFQATQGFELEIEGDATIYCTLLSQTLGQHITLETRAHFNNDATLRSILESATQQQQQAELSRQRAAGSDGATTDAGGKTIITQMVDAVSNGMSANSTVSSNTIIDKFQQTQSQKIRVGGNFVSGMMIKGQRICPPVPMFSQENISTFLITKKLSNMLKQDTDNGVFQKVQQEAEAAARLTAPSEDESWGSMIAGIVLLLGVVGGGGYAYNKYGGDESSRMGSMFRSKAKLALLGLSALLLLIGTIVSGMGGWKAGLTLIGIGVLGLVLLGIWVYAF